jgi:hypothetical protein
LIYRLIFYLGDEITELELPSGGEATVGSGENDALRIDRGNLAPSHLRLSSTDTGVHASSLVPMRIGGESSSNRVLSIGETAAVTEEA